jgi:predicted Na+-dependent transporter
MLSLIKNNLFMLLLVAASILTVSDTIGVISGPGKWLKHHHAPEVLIAGPRLWGIGQKIKPYTSILGQLGIVAIVWMGLSEGRETIMSNLEVLFPVILMVFCFHLALIAIAAVMIRLFGLGPGRRESVIFIGGQKTLALSVLLQVSLFPQYGIALVVCIVHHLIHLIMDAFLVQFFKSDRNQ